MPDSNSPQADKWSQFAEKPQAAQPTDKWAKYAESKAAPQAAVPAAPPQQQMTQTESGEPIPLDVAIRHAKTRVGKTQNWGDPSVTTPMHELGEGIASMGEKALQMGDQIYNVAKQLMPSREHPLGTPGYIILKQLFVDPAVAKAQHTMRAATGADSLGDKIAKTTLGGLATLDPVAPDVLNTYEQIQRGEYGAAIGGGAADIAMLRAGAKAKGPAAEKPITDYDLAHKALDNAWQFGGHKMLNDAIQRASAQMKQWADSIQQRDAASNAATRGGTGTLSITDAQGVVDKLLGSQKKPGVLDPAAAIRMPQAAGIREIFNDKAGSLMDFGTFKDIRSQVGKAWMRATKAGANEEAAGLLATYNKMGDQMASRASELGMSKEFSNYNTLHKQLTAAENGPIGDALAQNPSPMRTPMGNGTDFWSELHNPKMQRIVRGGLDDLQKYGLPKEFGKLMDNDVKPVLDAVVKQGGRFSWKERLALAGLFKTIGVPSPFLTAYSAMYVPEMFRSMVRQSVARKLGQGSMAPGSVFIPPEPSARGPLAESGAPPTAAPTKPAPAKAAAPEAESELEAARRGAPGIPPEAKSVRRQMDKTERAKQVRQSAVYKGKR